MKTTGSDLDPTMAAARTFNHILQLIQSSNLNFKLQLSPFAANISLKKTLVKDKSGISLNPCNDSPCDITELKAQNVKLEEELFVVKNEYANSIDEFETSQQMLKTFEKNSEATANVLKKELLESKILISKLVDENLEYKTLVESLENEKRDLEISNRAQKEAANRLNKNLSETKEKFNKEENEILKQHRAEIRRWRKELGDETRNKIKLEEKLKNTGGNIKIEQPSKKKLKISVRMKAVQPSCPEEVFCSICACIIPNYIPDYFCGEKYNPACTPCKERDSTWSQDDLFASFPSASPPYSLVTHWIPPTFTDLPKNPGSIVSMINHCVRFPSPGDALLLSRK